MTTDSDGLRGFVPRRIRESYGLKLALALVLVLFVVVGFGTQLYLTTNAQLGEDAEEQLAATATMHADQLDIWIDDSQKQTNLIAGSEPVNEGDEIDMRLYFSSLITDDQLTMGAQSVHYIDLETTEIEASSRDGRIGEAPRDLGEPWAQDDLTTLEEGEVRVTAFEESAINVTQVAFVTQVNERDDKGIVYTARTDAISELLHQSTETGFTTVVDPDGQVMIDQLNMLC
ncbi:cache domain-containing protein [Halobiforma nitratireducens]|uniref:Methyl-accepting chemotaxis sensory transducer n=1 Tax=Halobiforma nitratireducens JCM 10879 TaxID=1227454 RepID=M0LUL9_9EURY|nr:cache domain-containing protein [Halobiforma nitratireducens]EMA36863.1 methyl-accepting chemotaxis sensory transducer [Halobiforma nitratireducens JCM 10879]